MDETKESLEWVESKIDDEAVRTIRNAKLNNPSAFDLVEPPEIAKTKVPPINLDVETAIKLQQMTKKFPPKNPIEEPFVEFKGGGKRSNVLPPLFLVPPSLLKYVAITRLNGDIKYEPGNWKKFPADAFVDCLSHAIEHLLRVAQKNNSLNPTEEGFKTHLAHAATNIAFMLEAIDAGIINEEDIYNFAKISTKRMTEDEA